MAQPPVDATEDAKKEDAAKAAAEAKVKAEAAAALEAAEAAKDAQPDPPAKDRQEYERQQSRRVLRLKRKRTNLLTPEVIRNFKSNEKDYRNILRTGTKGRNQEELDVLKSGLVYRVYSLSDSDIQEDPQLFPAMNVSLSRDLGSAAPTAMMPNARERRDFRQLVFNMTMPLLEQLLKEGNFLARSSALHRMLDLEVVPPRGGGRMEMFDTVDDAYINVLKDPLQPDAIKAIAANCIKVYLQKADATPQIEIAFAEAITAELERPYLSAPYQITLLQALEFVRAPRAFAGAKPPVIYCSLVKLVADRSNDIEVRCRACRVMGRCGWDKQLNLDVLAWKTVELTAETAFLFNDSRDKTNMKWKYCGWYLYTAFHHETKAEAESAKSDDMPKGFLNRAPDSQIVRDAYKNGVAAMAHLLASNAPMPARVGGTALQWSTQNKPTDLKFDPACPPIPDPGAGGAANAEN
ncbi:MAG: hypothetical protein R3C59_27660 [Planctomycetaceae bacterium]